MVPEKENNVDKGVRHMLQRAHLPRCVLSSLGHFRKVCGHGGQMLWGRHIRQDPCDLRKFFMLGFANLWWWGPSTELTSHAPPMAFFIESLLVSTLDCGNKNDVRLNIWSCKMLVASLALPCNSLGPLSERWSLQHEEKGSLNSW